MKEEIYCTSCGKKLSNDEIEINIEMFLRMLNVFMGKHNKQKDLCTLCWIEFCKNELENM